MRKALSKLNPSQPYNVSAKLGHVHVIVTDSDKQLPAAYNALMAASPTHYGLRIAGGCSNMTAEDRSEMLDWFYANLSKFRGFVSSGATREVRNGQIDPMVTEVPALLASKRVITISTVPLVGRLELVDNSRLQIFREDQYGTSITHPNPGVHMIVVVQHPLGTPLDWDGDVSTYVNTFNEWRRLSGWQFALIVWNGGGVTKTEIKLAARSGWPVLLVEGSGRAADEYITGMHDGTLDLSLPDDLEPVIYNPRHHRLFEVGRHQPTSLRLELESLGFPI